MQAAATCTISPKLIQFLPHGCGDMAPKPVPIQQYTTTCLCDDLYHNIMCLFFAALCNSSLEGVTELKLVLLCSGSNGVCYVLCCVVLQEQEEIVGDRKPSVVRMPQLTCSPLDYEIFQTIG